MPSEYPMDKDRSYDSLAGKKEKVTEEISKSLEHLSAEATATIVDKKNQEIVDIEQKEKTTMRSLLTSMYTSAEAVPPEGSTDFESLLALLEKRGGTNAAEAGIAPIKKHLDTFRMLMKENTAIREGFAAVQKEKGTVAFRAHMKSAEDWNKGADSFGMNFASEDVKNKRLSVEGELGSDANLKEKVEQDPSMVLRELDHNVLLLAKEQEEFQKSYDPATDEGKNNRETLRSWWRVQVGREAAENVTLQPILDKISLIPDTGVDGTISNFVVLIPSLTPVNISKRTELLPQIKTIVEQDLTKEEQDPKKASLVKQIREYLNSIKEEDILLNYSQTNASVTKVEFKRPPSVEVKQTSAVAPAGTPMPANETSKKNMEAVSKGPLVRTLNGAAVPEGLVPKDSVVYGERAPAILASEAEGRMDELLNMEFVNAATGLVVDMDYKKSWIVDQHGYIQGFYLDEGKTQKALLRTSPNTESYDIELHVDSYEAYEALRKPTSEELGRWLMPEGERKQYNFYAAFKVIPGDGKAAGYKMIVRAVPKNSTYISGITALTNAPSVAPSSKEKTTPWNESVEAKVLGKDLMKTFPAFQTFMNGKEKEYSSRDILEQAFANNMQGIQILDKQIHLRMLGQSLPKGEKVLPADQQAKVLGLLSADYKKQLGITDKTVVRTAFEGENISFSFETPQATVDEKNTAAVAAKGKEQHSSNTSEEQKKKNTETAAGAAIDKKDVQATEGEKKFFGALYSVGFEFGKDKKVSYLMHKKLHALDVILPVEGNETWLDHEISVPARNTLFAAMPEGFKKDLAIGKSEDLSFSFLNGTLRICNKKNKDAITQQASSIFQIYNALFTGETKMLDEKLRSPLVNIENSIVETDKTTKRKMIKIPLASNIPQVDYTTNALQKGKFFSLLTEKTKKDLGIQSYNQIQMGVLPDGKTWYITKNEKEKVSTTLEHMQRLTKNLELLKITYERDKKDIGVLLKEKNEQAVGVLRLLAEATVSVRALKNDKAVDKKTLEGYVTALKTYIKPLQDDRDKKGKDFLAFNGKFYGNEEGTNDYYLLQNYYDHIFS